MVKKGSYEAAREANIARNNEFLSSLGFRPSSKKGATMDLEKPLSARKPRPCSDAKGQNRNPHRTPHPNLLPTHYPIPIPNPNPYPNPNPNPITDEGQEQEAKEIEEGPPTARRSRGRARERRRDEVAPHKPYPLSYLNRNPYSNPNPKRNP